MDNCTALRLFHASALDHLRLIQAGSVDTLVTDPPGAICLDFQTDGFYRTQFEAIFPSIQITSFSSTCMVRQKGLKYEIPRRRP